MSSYKTEIASLRIMILVTVNLWQTVWWQYNSVA